MAADIEERAHFARGVAHHQHRVLAHIGRQEISWSRELAVVTQIKPAAREDLLQFLLVNLRLDENPPADVPAGGIDEFTDIGSHRMSPIVLAELFQHGTGEPKS